MKNSSCFGVDRYLIGSVDLSEYLSQDWELRMARDR